MVERHLRNAVKRLTVHPDEIGDAQQLRINCDKGLAHVLQAIEALTNAQAQAAAREAENSRLFKSVLDHKVEIAAQEQRIAELEAENARLRGAIQSTAWTIANQPVAKALCQAVEHCPLGPSDDDGTLSLYDLIPEVWCGPDPTQAVREIAENIAFSALDAWFIAARAALSEPTT